MTNLLLWAAFGSVCGSQVMLVLLFIRERRAAMVRDNLLSELLQASQTAIAFQNRTQAIVGDQLNTLAERVRVLET